MSCDEFALALLTSGAVIVRPNEGEVYLTRGPHGRRLSEPRLTDGSDNSGYRVAVLLLDGEKKPVRFHRLVWIAANGLPPAGMAVCHRDNDKTNNRLENLYLATGEQNSTDAARDGLYRSGESNPATKLTDEDVYSIRLARSEGLTYQRLAELYGVSTSRIGQLVQGAR